MFDITQEEDYRELTLEEQYLVNGGAAMDQRDQAAMADAQAKGDQATMDAIRAKYDTSKNDSTSGGKTSYGTGASGNPGAGSGNGSGTGNTGTGNNTTPSSGGPTGGPSGNPGGSGPDNSSKNNNPFANNNTPWGADEQMEAARLAKEKAGYELKKTEYKDSGWDFGKSILEKIKDFGKSITYFHFEGRDAKNVITESYEDILKESKIEGGKWRLLLPEMSIYHQNDVGDPELKFICEDGREAVFSKDFTESGEYELYLDPKYKGTYNYVTISKTPTLPSDFNFSEIGSCIVDSIKFAGTAAGHFFADMVPYYLTGCKNERGQ